MIINKKIIYLIPIVVFFIIFSFALACNGQSEASSSTTEEAAEEGTGETSGIEETNESDITAEKEPDEILEEQEESEKDTSAEVTQIAIHLWENSIGTIWVHGAVEITNTGNTAIDIGDIQISVYDSDDNVVGSISGFILPVPEILEPGEKAYACESTIFEKIDTADIEIYAKANIDYDITDKESQNLEVQKIEGSEGDWNSYMVVGEVVNTSDKKADDIRICIALFDENGNLVAGLRPNVDVTLNPGDSMAFEGSYPDLPNNIGSKASSFVGKSYNWSWD